MSENDYQPQQERPSRTSTNPTRRTSPTRRSYSSTTSRRSGSGNYSSQGSYRTRSDNADTTRRVRGSERRAESDTGRESAAQGVLDSFKGAVSGGKEAISSRVASLGDQSERGARSGGMGEGPLQEVMDRLPGNIWVKRGILIAAALIIILILANLVTCAAGALSGGASSASSSSAATSSEASGSQSAASGSNAAATGVASPWTDSGTFTTGDSTLDAYIKDVCDKHSTQGATYSDNAYETYIYVSRTDYIERANNQSPWGPTWDVEYAKQYFEEGNTGNCYNYAAVVEYVLKYFGYSDAEAEPCVVALESGAWGDHGLVFVTNKENNKRCIIDSSLSANGWMLDGDSYQYDIRNINQNSTIQGNVDVLNDNNTPTRIPAGELTETESASSEAADTTTETDAATDTTADDGTAEEEVYYEEGYDETGYEEGDGDEEVYYEEVYYEEGDDGSGYDEEVYYEEDGGDYEEEA